MSTLTQESRTIWLYIVGLASILDEARRQESDLPSLADTRRETKKILKDAHEFLLERTSERNAYFVIFALVALTDESMQEYVQRHPPDTWLPLQTELFEITDAGTLFYQYIDYFRGRNDIPVIIYEVFYYCLKDGYKGSKIADPTLRTAYMEELKVHIPTEKDQPIDTRTMVTEHAQRRIPIYAYYLIASVILLAFRFGLELIPLNINI